MKISIFIICWLLIQTKNDYLFSVIISIYNTARYLEDSIYSLLNQTIGYRKIQIILITVRIYAYIFKKYFQII